jgi:hypothetical protein
MRYQNSNCFGRFRKSPKKLAGNVTELTIFIPELAAKRLELLKETLPA